MKKSKQPTQKSAEPITPEGVVISDGFKRRSLVSKLSKRQWLIAAIVVLVVAGGTGGYWLSHRSDKKVTVSDDDLPAYTISDKDFAKSQVESLKKSVPPASASNSDKVLYYTDLISSQYEAGQYADTIKSYQALTDVAQGPYSFTTYIAVAKSYVKTGDKDNARKVLDAAEQALKQTVKDPDQANIMTEQINAVRGEAS